MFTYPIHTTVHCNRCDKAFQLQRERAGSPIEGQSIARLQEFETCPHCGMMDCHFVYAHDYLYAMPPAILAIKTLCNLHVTDTVVIGAGTTLDVKAVFPTNNGQQPTVLAVHAELEFYVRPWEYTTDLTLATGAIVRATLQRIESKIQRGLKAWSSEPKRKHSGEVDSGCWWTLHGDPREFPRWSVSWIIETGELYAWSARDDKYILLISTAPRDEARSEFLLEGWANSDSAIHNNLTALMEQIEARRDEPTPQRFTEKFNRAKRGFLK